jgi:hypothetical protein
MKQVTPWVIAWGGDSNKGASHTISAFRAANQMEGVILGVNVQMNADKHFYAVPQGWPLPGKSMPDHFIGLNDEQVKNLDLGDGQPPLRLEAVFEAFPLTPVFLWISDNIENIDLRLEPILKKYGDRQNILIHSEYDNVAKSLKALLPQLLYGTGVGQRIRLLMLSDLWLETVAAVDGDFVLSALKERGVSVISGTMKSEVARRQKIFIVGPLLSLEENGQAISPGVTGYLTVHPQDLKNKLKEKSTTVDLSSPSR